MKVLTFVLAITCVTLLQQCQSQEPPPGCPRVDHHDATTTYLPNPYNCSTYYVCVQGTPLLMICPPGLHFNEKDNVCDWPYRADCFEIPLPAPTEEPASVSKLMPTSEATSYHMPPHSPTPTTVPEEPHTKNPQPQTTASPL
ncbi:unnamed protein product, partial [Ixodes pacificus]